MRLPIALLIFAVSLTGAAAAEGEVREHEPDAQRIEGNNQVSIGLVGGRVWLPRVANDTETPQSTYLGVWAERAVGQIVALGAVASTSVNPFGCDGDTRCYDYRLVRLGLNVGLRLPLTENANQGLEIFSVVGPEIVRTSKPGDQRADTASWGGGATVRVGPRLRMGEVLLAPHAELSVFTAGAHVALGMGVQLGVRFDG